jgi:hypothetical protein
MRMQKTEIRSASRFAVLSFDSSAPHLDFRILWKTSIFQYIAYQSSFSVASGRERTGRPVISFHSIVFRPMRASRSRAWVTTRSGLGCCYCLPISGNTWMRRYLSSSTAWQTTPCSSRVSMRCIYPLFETSSISSAIECSPSPARRSTHVRTTKCVPSAKSGPLRTPITVEGGHPHGDCGQQVMAA